MDLADLPRWASHRLSVQYFSKFNVNTGQQGILLTCRSWFSHFWAELTVLPQTSFRMSPRQLVCRPAWWSWRPTLTCSERLTAMSLVRPLTVVSHRRYLEVCNNPTFKSEYCKQTYQIWWKPTLDSFSLFLYFSMSKDRQNNFICVDKEFDIDL